MAIAVNDRVRVILSSWMDGQLGLNILHYRCTAVGGVGLTADAAAFQFFADVQPLFTPLLSASAVFFAVSVRDITEVPLMAAGVSDNPEEPGEVTGDPLPAQCTGLVKVRSNLAGRANRGRMYVPFPGEVDSDSSHTPIASYLTRLATLCDFLFAPVVLTAAGDSLDLQPIIKHAGAGDVDVISYTLRDAWATQRRRGTLGRLNPKIPAV